MVWSLSITAALLALSATTFAAPRPLTTLKTHLKSIEGETWSTPAHIKVTDNVIPLTRKHGRHGNSEYFRRAQLVRREIESGSETGVEQLAVAHGGAEYIGEILFGNQTVSVVMDTGSSDTWLVSSTFQCTNSRGDQINQAKCNFGDTYKGELLTVVPDVNFNISYGDGEFVTGIFGTQDVTVGGITVPSQTVALGTSAYWRGDAITAGLLGLAYPGLTSEFSGNNPKENDYSKRMQYDPIFTTMYKQGLSSPMFSMALQRGKGGYMAFGGVPAAVTPSSEFATTPITKMTNSKLGNGPNYYFYSIKPEAVVYPGAPAVSTKTYIVDSGTTLIYAPSEVAQAINAAFDPPATLNSGVYVVDCNYKSAPNVGFTIGGTTFNISSADLTMKDSGSGLCVSGIQDGGSTGPYILGDTFMNNVISVFDVGNGQMSFAQHNY